MRLLPSALALLVAATAFGQSRLEARRHFQRGMTLIGRGAYDAGIDELQAAYAIKPHPNVLYNIARAHDEAGHDEQAALYYRRYLATHPPDAPTVQPTLDALEAKLAAKAPPPEPTPRPPPTSVDPALVDRLQSLADRMDAALSRLEEGSKPKPPPKETAPGEEALLNEDERAAGSAPYEETVAIASRRSQTSLEAPNSTTVITADEIRASGATSLVELLRRVPGAEVMAMGVGSANASFRGFNQRSNNKVLVLLDGRTEYQDWIGVTLWPALPVGLEEIDRIEIIRGPGSALYGANAMLGVINIITRQEGTGPRAELNGIAGGGATAGGSFVASDSAGRLRYRASAGYLQQDKWSRDFEDDRPDIAPTQQNTSLGVRSARANLSARFSVSPDVELAASAGVNRLASEYYSIGVQRNFFYDGVAAYAQAQASAGPLRLRAFWNGFDTDTGPQYAPIGERSIVTHINSNIFATEAMFSRELALLGNHRLDVGAEGRLKRVGWDYLDDHFRSELHGALFVQDEWRIADPVRIIASYRIDRHPLLNKGKPGYAQSPRISALFFPAQGHALRASFATAFREPTFLESYVALRNPVPGVNGAYALSSGDTALRAERLTALELGYRGEVPSVGLEWDLALYRNEVADLITLSALRPLPAGESFDEVTQGYLLGVTKFENEAAVYTALGGELGATISPLDRFVLRGALSAQHISQSGVPAGTPCAPCSQAPQLKLYGGGTYHSTTGVDASLEGQYVTATTWIEREPGATDPTTIEARENPLPAYLVVHARLAYRLLQDKLTVALIGSHVGIPHREHPFGNLIERRVYATITVTP